MLFSSMLRYHRLRLEFMEFTVIMVFMESVEISESVGIVELRMSLEIKNHLKVTYLSHAISAIVIVVEPMWMDLTQVVVDLPFMLSLVIVEVFVIIGLDVAMFVVQVVTVEVAINAIEVAIVAAVEVATTIAVAIAVIVAIAIMVTLLRINHRFTCLSPTHARLFEKLVILCLPFLISVQPMVVALIWPNHKSICLDPMFVELMVQIIELFEQLAILYLPIL